MHALGLDPTIVIQHRVPMMTMEGETLTRRGSGRSRVAKGVPQTLAFRAPRVKVMNLMSLNRSIT